MRLLGFLKVKKLDSELNEVSNSKMKGLAYIKKALQIPSWCNLSQDSNGPIDFNSQSRGNLYHWALWNVNLRDVRQRPVWKRYHQHTANQNTQLMNRMQFKTTYLLMKKEALDHKNTTARAAIKMWQINVRKWYSSNSNKIHAIVAPPRTPPDNFLSLHRKISAAVRQTIIILYINENWFFVNVKL